MKNELHPFISVIIQVYNGEEYLSVCIESLIHQDDILLEIVMIDDSSTDLTGKICNQYAGSDNRIKVIHVENHEASTARNAGLNPNSASF